MQEPVWQVALMTQTLPGSHGVPFSAFGGLAGHTPFAGLHVPVTWHWSVAGGHAIGLPLLHVPVWHVAFG